MVLVQAPQGASLDYTMNIIGQVEDSIRQVPEARRLFAAGGFSFAGSAPNQGILFLNLADFEERTRPDQSAQAIVGKLFGAFSRIPGAIVMPFLPPTINGLGIFGGFEYQLLDQSGGAIEDLATAARQIVAQGNQTPGLTGLSRSSPPTIRRFASTSTANRRKAWGCRSATSPGRCRCCSGRPT
jgi:HAE1 family hydrophobic/amphiphilic exporter-1